jgi:hypothetical protein
MMLDRVEIRKEFLNRVMYLMVARIQKVGGISSRINEDYSKHRILWDLDTCSLNEAKDSLRKIQKQYNLGKIYIISDKEKSYGAVCNSIVSFKELLHILIDTDLIDPLYIRYAFQRHEAILRLSDKEGRLIHREIIEELNPVKKDIRPRDDNGYYTVNYQTGYIKKGLRSGDFYNDQKVII